MFSKGAGQIALFLIMGFSVGAWFSYALIAGAPSVFLHELKHSIMSNLAGNRAKGMKIKRKTGHFTYQYTADTAKYNAMIALAPYFLPLFTVSSILIVLVFLREHHNFAVAAVAFGFGADLVLNFRDVSPIQTDLTRITGGYNVGVTFVVAMNFVMGSFLVIWAFGGWVGIQDLFAHMNHILHAIINEFRSTGST